MSSSITSLPFKKLVQSLKQSKKTCTVIEQCCGGAINASILAQAGASSVYVGGSIVYNTRKAKGLLLNDDNLYNSLTYSSQKPQSKKNQQDEAREVSDKESYIQSKFNWTAETSVAFCKALNTDYAIAESGAAGPTFRYDDMNTGFAVLSIAGKKSGDGGDENVQVLKQTLVHSTHADREKNMRLFADVAANLMIEVLKDNNENKELSKEEYEKEEANKEGLECKSISLDRATKLRSDEQALADLVASPGARYVIVRKGDILVRSASELAMLTYDELALLKKNDSKYQQTFLGLLSDESRTPMFGIDILVDANNKSTDISPFEGCYYVDTRTSAPLLPPLENELALHVMAYANWQRRSRFCSSCGAHLSLIHAGTTQQCTSCKSLSWPRQDPSMIASITSRCGERILLARSKRHPPKMHTVLAGFVEAGETFEHAVAREVWEETGIRIDEGSVKYIGSQPWPFPQSCMIAFTATADDRQTLHIDENEILEAKWFDRKDVVAATQVEGPVMQHEVAKAALEADPSLSLLVPPKRVIARTLIDTWLMDGISQRDDIKIIE